MSITSATELEVFGDNLLLEPIFLEEVDGLVRGVTDDQKADQGKIVGIGDNASRDSGITFNLGDIVIFNRYAPDKIDIFGTEYLILHAADVKGRKKAQP